MRLIKKWRIVLIICVAAIAIPIAARVSPTQTAVDEPQLLNAHEQVVAYNEVAETDHPRISKAGIPHRVAPPQDYYDRRREYWEERMERRADYLEQEDGDDDEDAADTADSKDSAAEDDEGDSMGDEEEMLERRREYWRDRLDRDW